MPAGGRADDASDDAQFHDASRRDRDGGATDCQTPAGASGAPIGDAGRGAGHGERVAVQSLQNSDARPVMIDWHHACGDRDTRTRRSSGWIFPINCVHSVSTHGSRAVRWPISSAGWRSRDRNGRPTPGSAHEPYGQRHR